MKTETAVLNNGSGKPSKENSFRNVVFCWFAFLTSQTAELQMSMFSHYTLEGKIPINFLK